MEIRIAYHPSSETLINRISELLKENGISAEFTSAASAAHNDVQITFTKEKKNEIAPTLLDSSFVHVEHQPGY